MEDKKSDIDFSGLFDSDFTDFEVAKPAGTRNRERRGNDKEPRGKRVRGNDKSRAPRERRSRPSFRENANKPSEKSYSNKPARTFPPMPVATLNFYPEDKTITALVNAIKVSGRTYTLFAIANLLLEKPARFNVMITALARKGETEARPLVISVPDNMPFIYENEALAHACDLAFPQMFDIAETEVEAPKGDYKMVAVCGIDNAVISAPNYHGYNQALHAYHAEHFARMPFEKFVATVKNSSDEVLVKSWLDSMTKRTVYILKERAEGEPEKFESKHAAIEFICKQRKEKLITTAAQWRIAGTMIEQLPKGKLRAQIEFELAKQRKFPLETANGFRGRLRHMGLSFFRKAPENITVVSGIRRKFRTPSAHFSDDIQRIFDYLDKNQNSKLDALIVALLGEDASDEAKTKLAGSLHWLVSEGYVCEMETGELFVFQVMSEEQAKAAENNEPPKQREALETVEDESGITQTVPVMPETIAPEA